VIGSSRLFGLLFARGRAASSNCNIRCADGRNPAPLFRSAFVRMAKPGGAGCPHCGRRRASSSCHNLATGHSGFPCAGYSFESTPLWAGIYMLPMTGRLPGCGFRLAGSTVRPLRARGPFTVGGMILMTADLRMRWWMIPHVDLQKKKLLLFAVMVFLKRLWRRQSHRHPNPRRSCRSVPPPHGAAGRSGVRGAVLQTGRLRRCRSAFLLGYDHRLSHTAARRR